MKRMVRKIALVTPGGDASGMNACIRAVVRTALRYGYKVAGVMNGYQGMLDGEFVGLERRSVSGIINLGGTILKSSRCKAIRTPADMKGMKLRVPQAPMYLMFTKAVGANAVPIAFSEVYLALQNGTVDGQENPLPTIQAKKFYEVQSHINLTNHITSDLIAVMGAHVWNRLTPAERQTFETVFKEMAERSTATIRASELSLEEWFKQQGKTVVQPDIAAFREAAVKLHNDPAAGAVWPKEIYDRLQALK